MKADTLRHRIALAGACILSIPFLCALPVRAEDDGRETPKGDANRVSVAPPIGEWSLSGASPAGKRISGTLVILTNQDSRLEGYVRWKSPGKPSTIEVFHGDYDARTGQIGFRGFEILSRQTTDGIGRYSARYDAKKREIVEGTAIPLLPGGIRGNWTASFREGLPASQPRLMNLPYSDGNWPALCRNVSEGFARGRIGHWHFANTPELNELVASEDARLLALAKLRLAELAFERIAKSPAAAMPEHDTLVVDAAMELLKEQFPLDEQGTSTLPTPLQRLVHQTTHDTVRRAQSDERLANRALEGLIATTLRSKLIEAAWPMRRRSELRDDDIRARCRPAMDGGLVARITNKAGKQLDRCLIVTQFSVDPNEVEKASHLPAEQRLAQAAVAKWFGIPPNRRQPASQALEYYWAFESLDKGSICYLETWPDEGTIDVDLASAPCHCIEGTVAKVFVFSSGGSLDVTIDGPSLRTAFAESRMDSKSALASKPKKPKKAKRSRPRQRRRAPS